MIHAIGVEIPVKINGPTVRTGSTVLADLLTTSVLIFIEGLGNRTPLGTDTIIGTFHPKAVVVQRNEFFRGKGRVTPSS